MAVTALQGALLTMLAAFLWTRAASPSLAALIDLKGDGFDLSDSVVLAYVGGLLALAGRMALCRMARSVGARA